MLLLARKLSELSFSSLMEVYMEGNQANAAEEWPHLPAQFALEKAEQDFFLYLSDVFFKTPGACYAIWQENGHYVCAFRLEPYRDGLLLEGLETKPICRRKGYAQRLIKAVFNQFPDIKIYSHVHKQNFASLKTHESCEFKLILDHAVYIDGSVNQRACTLLHE